MKLLKKMGAILLSLCMITIITLQLDNSVAKAEVYETTASNSTTDDAQKEVNVESTATMLGSTRDVNYAHNFTTDGKNSSIYTITGNLSTSKGTATYDGLTLTQCLKMESATNISFTPSSDGKLILVFASTETGKRVKINGTNYTTDSNAIVEVDVKAGAIAITKTDGINLFYMNFIPASTPDPTTAPVTQLGVSYRESTDQYGNGIRFGGQLDLTQVDENALKASGTLIGLASVVGETPMTLEEAGSKCLEIKRDTYISKDENKNTLDYAAAIVNIPETALDTVIVARPYVTIDGTTYYGEQIKTTYQEVQEKANAQ